MRSSMMGYIATSLPPCLQTWHIGILLPLHCVPLLHPLLLHICSFCMGCCACHWRPSALCPLPCCDRLLLIGCWLLCVLLLIVFFRLRPGCIFCFSPAPFDNPNGGTAHSTRSLTSVPPLQYPFHQKHHYQLIGS